jgi:hypothetical protein
VVDKRLRSLARVFRGIRLLVGPLAVRPQLVSMWCVAVRYKDARLVVKLPVLVLAEERDPDGRQGVRLKQPQTLLEGVVDVDTAAGANNGSTSRAIKGQQG